MYIYILYIYIYMPSCHVIHACTYMHDPFTCNHTTRPIYMWHKHLKHLYATWPNHIWHDSSIYDLAHSRMKFFSHKHTHNKNDKRTLIVVHRHIFTTHSDTCVYIMYIIVRHCQIVTTDIGNVYLYGNVNVVHIFMIHAEFV